MAKAKKISLPQSLRFVQAAKKAGVDESGRTFAWAIKTIARMTRFRK